jgi:DNA modification methylase
MAFTDPVRNVHLAGYASRRANVGGSAMELGVPSSEEFIEFLQTTSAHIAANVVDGALIYLCTDWWHLDDLSAATRRYFGKPKDMVVWVKTNSGRGMFYRSQHEHIAVYVAGTAAPNNNFRLGQRGQYRANVWNYPGFNTFETDQASALSGTEKPVALIVDALRDCSRRGETVLDPFGGSGTTMMAAERTGRLGRLIEIDPSYCDVIVRRWQKISDKTAHLAGSKETFSQVEARRRHADGGQE